MSIEEFLNYLKWQLGKNKKAERTEGGGGVSPKKIL